MDQENKVLRFGAAVILCAIVFRLLSGGILAPVVRLLQNDRAVALMMFLETGRSEMVYDFVVEGLNVMFINGIAAEGFSLS